MSPSYSLAHDGEYQLYRQLRAAVLADQTQHDESGIKQKLGSIMTQIRGRGRSRQMPSGDSSRGQSITGPTTPSSGRSSVSGPPTVPSLFDGAGRTASPDRNMEKDAEEMDLKAALTEIELVDC